MSLTLNHRFDPRKPCLVLYFQLSLNNKLFGHTLKNIYLPFFRMVADREEWNLIYAGYVTSGPNYVLKQTDVFDGIFVPDADERELPPATYREFFAKINHDELKRLDVARLVSLTTPIVIRDSVKEHTLDGLLNLKQSSMVFLTNAHRMMLGGAWLANLLDQPLHHVIVDPLEADYRNIKGFDKVGQRYFLYESTMFGAKALHICEDTYQDMHANRAPAVLDVEKELDIVIGYSITQKSRLWMQSYDFEQALAGSGLNYGVFLKDTYRDIDTFLWDKTAYLSMLEAAKYTLMIPSYEARAFSTIRFIEALYSSSVPLILDKCVLDEAFDQHERDLLEPLIVSDKTIAEVIKRTNYEVKLRELQEWFLEKKPLQTHI